MATQDPTTPEADQPSHFLHELGTVHRIVDGLSRVDVDVVDAMLVPGTDVVRMGLLVILVDLATGMPATGSVTPTVDLSVRVARYRPARSISAVSSVLKAGATLLVADCVLRADGEEEPFATALATFMNRPLPGARGPLPGTGPLRQPLAERIGAEVVRPGLVQLAPSDDLANPHHGTLQGGAVALLGELAAASLFAESGPAVVTELDVRYLARVKEGPVQAEARPLASGPAGHQVAVTLRDLGADRTVAYLATTCTAADDAR